MRACGWYQSVELTNGTNKTKYTTHELYKLRILKKYKHINNRYNGTYHDIKGNTRVLVVLLMIIYDHEYY